MSLLDAASALLLCAAGFFFAAGTVGVLRFPDVYARLHALTKVDNVGLGLLVAGLVLRADSPAAAAKLVLIWCLALAAAAAAAYLIAGHARRER